MAFLFFDYIREIHFYALKVFFCDARRGKKHDIIVQEMVFQFGG